MPMRVTSLSRAASRKSATKPDPSSRRILVIGGTKFIGRLLVQKLAAAGHEIYILHRKSRHPFSKRVHNLVADRNDAESVRKAVGSVRFDAVYDLAYDWERGTTGRQVEAIAQIFDGKVG